MRWMDLSQEQRCVMVAARDESDLSSALLAWDGRIFGPDQDRSIEVLGRAVRDLVHAGLVELYPSEIPPAEVPLTAQEVEEVLSNRGAWIRDEEEGLEVVVWMVHTDFGRQVYQTATMDDLYSYRDRPGRTA